MRTKRMKSTHANLRLTNVENGETVHQRCLLITGECLSISSEDFVLVTSTGANDSECFPEQTWPIQSGCFTALVFLSPGANNIEISRMAQGHQTGTSLKIALQYIPLLQYPPLHLAIMVAKDSPLLIDCPPQKAGAFSSAHSELSAAIEKFRLTAYMWQAIVAEDFRAKGLGRRTFRLEEEWTTDTVSREFANSQHSNRHASGPETASSTAKVTVVTSSRSRKEILYAEREERKLIYPIFMEALLDHGGQFDKATAPVVAGLILDTHYNKTTKQLLGHAYSGHRDRSGISLGTFGSHLTFSWPRFTEEITSCLTDIRSAEVPNGQFPFSECCAFGQASFLSAVELAFGLESSSNKRKGARNWRKQFLAGTDTPAGSTEELDIPSCANLSLKDSLELRLSRHFFLPTDKHFTDVQRSEKPTVEPKFTDNKQGGLDAALSITSTIGIVRITFNGISEAIPSIDSPVFECGYTQEELEQSFGRSKPLRLVVLGFNGKETIISNVWMLLTNKNFIRIPGSSVRLFKRSVCSSHLERSSNDDLCEWAQLLKERGPDGNIHRATSIDLCVGCWWDGGVVKYADGHTSHWGPMCTNGRYHQFGGHASQTMNLPPDANIKWFDVNTDRDSEYLRGVRMCLTDNTVRGALNASRSSPETVHLEPTSHEVIVGFYGKSGRYDGVMEFGIITVAKDVGLDGLPDAVYDLPELRNTLGMGDGERTFDDEGDSDIEDRMDEDSGDSGDSSDEDDQTIDGED